MQPLAALSNLHVKSSLVALIVGSDGGSFKDITTSSCCSCYPICQVRWHSDLRSAGTNPSILHEPVENRFGDCQAELLRIFLILVREKLPCHGVSSNGRLVWQRSSRGLPKKHRSPESRHSQGEHASGLADPTAPLPLGQAGTGLEVKKTTWGTKGFFQVTSSNSWICPTKPMLSNQVKSFARDHHCGALMWSHCPETRT